jgi:hypothetical protein
MGHPVMTLPLETARFEALKKLTAERFGEIEPAEEVVLWFSGSSEDLVSPISEMRPEVRAAFLRWLATDKEVAAHIDPLGLRVANATIISSLNLNFCKIPFRLRFRHCTLRGDINLDAGELPALELSNCTTEYGISADGVRVQGDVFLRKLEAKGELRFLGAQIGGDFDCSGGSLTAEGNALSADKANISGNIFLREGFSCSGKVRFLGAQIGGDLSCVGATLSSEGDAFSADKMNVTGSVFLREGLACSGEIRLLGAQIGGDLDCSRATLTAEGDALNAHGAQIAGYVYLCEKFFSSGKVSFNGARIGGDLSCSNARIKCLVCEDMRLGGDLIWTAIQDGNKSELDLIGASVKTLHDDTSSWPAPCKLAIKGLEYMDLVHHAPSEERHLRDNRLPFPRELDSRERVRWLRLQNRVNRLDPQAWMWLAKLFKEKGQDGDARWVLLNYRLMQAISGSWLMLPLRLPLALFSWEPLLVLFPFLLILCWGAQTYQKADDQNQILPTAADIFVNKAPSPAQTQADGYKSAYPVFSPWIYTLENELPLVKFGMDDKWAPDPNLPRKGQARTYWWLAGFRWFLIIAGWVQGILLTLGINRRFHD